MASSSSIGTTLQKSRYTFATFSIFCLFLLTISIAFSKRSIDPSFSLYRHLFFSPTSVLSSSFLLPPRPPPPPGAVFDHSSAGFTGNNLNHYNKTPSTALSVGTLSSSWQSIISGSIQEENHPITRRESESASAITSKNESWNESGGNVSGVEMLKNWAKSCDIYVGSWVKNEKVDEDYPLYRPGSCPYVDEAFDCQNNGRQDSDYLKWRWKPDGCELPRFNATDFLLRLKGKRLMLIGDSMNRNQFESLLCLLREGIPDKSRMYEVHGYKITKGRGYYMFKFEDYNCTVEFVRSHFLVKEGIRINGQGNSNPTLSIDQIDKSAERWKRADILVFNTGHWWTHGKTARGKNYYKEGDYIYPHFDAVEAYRKALKTWAKWIDGNVDPVKKLVFYRGYSSAHFRGGHWDSGGTCKGETAPISSGAFLKEYPFKMKIVEEVIREMKFPVTLLNVTSLTNFRKDGHPSIYGKKKSESSTSKRRQDCSHWCLPGVPDAWNELIYATLVFQQTSSFAIHL